MTKKHRTGNLFQRGNVWWLKYMVEGRLIRQSLRTNDRKEAEKQRDAVMRPIMVGNRADALAIIKSKLDDAKTEVDVIHDEQNPPTTIDGAWDAFVKSPNRPDSGSVTLEAYQFQWEAFVRWVKSNHPAIQQLRQANQEIAEEYAAHLTIKGITPNTFNKHICLCALVFDVLSKKAKTPYNPFAKPERAGGTGIQRKRLVTQHHRELTTEELVKVCQSASGELRAMLAMGLYLGTRLGDAALMDWGAIDMIKRFIRYTPRKTARRSGKILTVPLHRVLFDVLNETPPVKRKGYVHPDMAKLYTTQGPTAVTGIVRNHFKKCGIKTNNKGRGVRQSTVVSFHSLRHSAVTLLREAGAPLSVTMAIVGHFTLAMHDTYSHAGESALKKSVAAMPSVMGELPKALPATQTVGLPPPAADIRVQVNTLADRLNGRNWKTVKAELLQACSRK